MSKISSRQYFLDFKLNIIEKYNTLSKTNTKLVMKNK